MSSLTFDGLVGLKVRMMVAEKTRDNLLHHLHGLSAGSNEMSQTILDLERIERVITTYTSQHDKLYGMESK